MRTRKRYVILFAVMALLMTVVAGTVHAKKVQVTREPVSDYDFKSVEKIVVMPVTSDGVDYGKVAEKRMPKIEAILEKTKKRVRNELVDATRLAETTIPLLKKIPNRGLTTVLLELYVNKFDNGNQVARKMIPFAGKAKVGITGRLVSASDGRVLTEFFALRKTKSGMTNAAGIGAFDSDVLAGAAQDATGDIFRHLSKLTGFKYKIFSHLGEKAKKGTDATVDVVKEEKAEVSRSKKKSKGR